MRDPGVLDVTDDTVSVTDLSPRTAEASSTDTEPGQDCTTHYKVVLDTFSIYGVDWDTFKLEEDGTGLKKQIKKCGALTDWKFTTEDVEAPWSFHATGKTIIGVQECIGRAVKAAGGPRASCGGTT